MTNQLRSDGDTLELEDGRVLRLRVTADDWSLDQDGDWFGRVGWWAKDERPDWCDGSAEILDHDGATRLWWMPPADAKNDDVLKRNLRADIKEILAYGYSTYTLELCEGRDAYGNPIVREPASIGGVAPLWKGSDVDDLVDNLRRELGLETSLVGHDIDGTAWVTVRVTYDVDVMTDEADEALMFARLAMTDLEADSFTYEVIRR